MKWLEMGPVRKIDNLGRVVIPKGVSGKPLIGPSAWRLKFPLLTGK